MAASAVELDPWGTSGAASVGFAALGRAIGDARVVLLGEPWHGDGGAIRLRTELVRYLHEHLGFDVLAFEADFFSVTKGWAETSDSAAVFRFASDNVYPFWSTSRASQGLWRYLAQRRGGARPLHVVGLDPKHVGRESRRSLPPELERRLVQLTKLSPEQRARFLSVLDSYLQREQIYRPTATEQHGFLEALDTLERAMLARPAAEREPFWEQEVRNLRLAVQYSWQSASRDRAMGENLAWIATQLHPGKKIIVWAHNNHVLTDKWMYFAAPDTAIQRGIQRRSPASIYRTTYLGAEVKQLLGPRVYSLALLSHEGSFTPDVRTNVEPDSGEFERGDFDAVKPLVPAPAGTLEAALAAAGRELAFINLAPFRGIAEPVSARVLDYSVTPPRAMRYWEGYDGILFIRQTFGLNEQPPRGWHLAVER